MLAFSAVPAPWGLIGQVLLLAILLLLAGGFALHAYDDDRLARMPKITELPQSLLLIFLAVLVWLTAARETALNSLGLLTALGIALGFLGDLFMANIFKQEKHVLWGMAAFATGHIFYMLGFREIALHFALHDLGSYGIALVVMWIVALVIWALLVRNPSGDPTMQYAALVYALFLASMAAYAVGLALQEGAFWPLACGGILFLFSDSLIASKLFAGRRFRYMGDVEWTTYILAQVLIVTVVPVALAL